ncbi:MAG: hypothetical protein CMO05_08540 [Thalassospira sp.]|uniref:hypothetical protein n=1 Tax=Thalassospira sp. GB04J01 TaxID=1485225 RepID=UPI000C0CB0DF|nr:hypothetical protein [Thalassospira sp. GB04J01]MBV17508.1 hypothetical protein [Thalassospira sp.]|tara:strand:- start:3 stop:617 length:615 start_codon:yes stop_codon:yes gene_type:complete
MDRPKLFRVHVHETGTVLFCLEGSFMPSNSISLKGGFLSLERTSGVSDEYALTIHLSHTQLAELFGPVIDVKSLTLEAQRAKEKAQERAKKAREQAFDEQIARTISLGRQFENATRAYVEDGLTDIEAVALVAHEMFVTQDELRRCRQFARKHDRRERDEKIFKLYKAGKSNAAIAKKMELHPVSVARVISVLKRRKEQSGGAK